MLNRRNFAALLAAVGIAGHARAQTVALPFYASIGPELALYHLDVGTAALARRSTITLPANVQYAWPHPSGRFLYVIASNGQPPSGPAGVAGADKNHYAIAFRVSPDGSLIRHGEPRLLPVRPLHTCVDHTGGYLLIAYNIPSMVSVHRLAADGTIGEEVKQASAPDFGIYAHQVRETPSGRTVTLVSRGNDATAARPEDPGHIEVFGFQDGQLTNLQSLAPHGNGLGFGPRHLDFHPNGKFAFVSLERENGICVYGMTPDGRLSAEPLFVKNALLNPGGKASHPGQGSGPIHVHPNGRFVYQTNRGSGTVERDGRKVSNGGENSVVVWSLDQETGEPTRIQNASAHGFELRTFAIDPSGRILIAASTTSLPVLENGMVKTVSAGLSVYRIGADGKLSFVRKQDVDTSRGIQFWSGFLTMA